jgi:hypothetical protein
MFSYQRKIHKNLRVFFPARAHFPSQATEEILEFCLDSTKNNSFILVV